MTNLLFNDCLVQISNNYRAERYKEVFSTLRNDQDRKYC